MLQVLTCLVTEGFNLLTTFLHSDGHTVYPLCVPEIPSSSPWTLYGDGMLHSPGGQGAKGEVMNGSSEAGHPWFNYLIQQSAVIRLA